MSCSHACSVGRRRPAAPGLSTHNTEQPKVTAAAGKSHCRLLTWLPSHSCDQYYLSSGEPYLIIKDLMLEIKTREAADMDVPPSSASCWVTPPLRVNRCTSAVAFCCVFLLGGDFRHFLRIIINSNIGIIQTDLSPLLVWINQALFLCFGFIICYSFSNIIFLNHAQVTTVIQLWDTSHEKDTIIGELLVNEGLATLENPCNEKADPHTSLATSSEVPMARITGREVEAIVSKGKGNVGVVLQHWRHMLSCVLCQCSSLLTIPWAWDG